MTRKRRHREAALRREQIRQREFERLRASGLPVDRAQLAPCKSYDPPRFINRGFYLDILFDCLSCGSEEVWTAARQKWWYEEAKGNLHSGVKHCRKCRQELRAVKGLAQPLKDAGSSLEATRGEIEMLLHADGWRRVIRDDDSYHGARSYIRGDVSIRIRWDHVDWRIHFILERGVALSTSFQTLLQVDCEHRNRTLSELRRRLNGLPRAIEEVLKTEFEHER